MKWHLYGIDGGPLIAAPSSAAVRDLERRAAMGGRHRPAQQRQYYARRRLADLRAICPDLPDDVLSRVPLRALSFAVRRAGRARHVALQSDSRPHEGNFERTRAQLSEGARSNAENSGEAQYQNSYPQYPSTFAAATS